MNNTEGKVTSGLSAHKIRSRFTFGKTPSPLLRDASLSARAKAAYALLDDHAGKDGQAFPKIKTLEALLGCARTSVKEALKELEDAGWIHRELRPNSSTLFHLECFPWGSAERPGGVGPPTGGESAERPAPLTRPIELESLTTREEGDVSWAEALVDNWRQYRQQQDMRALGKRGLESLFELLVSWGQEEATRRTTTAQARGWSGPEMQRDRPLQRASTPEKARSEPDYYVAKAEKPAPPECEGCADRKWRPADKGKDTPGAIQISENAWLIPCPDCKATSGKVSS